jgi:predicted DNA-binding transcriptional regulator AlpA
MPETSPVALLSGANPAPGGAPPSPRLLTEKQVAALLGVTTRTLQRWRVTGNGPAWIRVGPRIVRYSEAVMAEWAGGRTFAHRAAELAGGAA